MKMTEESRVEVNGEGISEPRSIGSRAYKKTD